MNYDQNDELLSYASDISEDKNLKYIRQIFINIIFAENDNQSKKSNVMTQELLLKLQRLREVEDDWKSSIRKNLALCNELINIFENITINDATDLQTYLQLLCEKLFACMCLIDEKTDKIFIRELYFELLDLLNKPQISSYLNNNENIIIPHKAIYKGFTILLLVLAHKIVPSVPFEKDDTTTDKYDDLLRAMSNQLKTKLKYDHQTRRFILLFLWDFSDRVVTIPWLLNVDFVETMLQCLKMIDFSSGFVDHFLGIIHNIARHDNGVDELRKFDGLHILKEFQSQFANKLDPNIDLLLSMAIALLSTSEQIRSDNKRMNKILNQLLQIVIEAAGASNFCARSFHISEPLAVLTKLFVDDYSLEYVLNHAETDPQLTTALTISLFTKLLIKFQSEIIDTRQLRQFTSIALTNILWSISFQDRFKTKLIQDKELLQVIERLAMNNNDKVVDQYVPRSMESISKAANGILHNLNEVTVVDTQIITVGSRKKLMIMISYAHLNDTFCDKILEVLKNENLFDIWIDRDHLSSSESLWEKIARGIRESNLVILLLSQDYFDSKSCRKEASFAVQREKQLFLFTWVNPVIAIDIHIADLKYIRFKNFNTELDHNKVQELLKTIRATIRETQTNPPSQQAEQHYVPMHPEKEMETVKSITIDMNKPPEQWTADDIHKWFDSHNVPETLVRLFDFQSIAETHEYSEKLRSDPKTEYTKYGQKYSKMHGGDELEEYKFNRFKTAIFSLIDKHPKPVQISTSGNSSVTSKSSVCTIL